MKTPQILRKAFVLLTCVNVCVPAVNLTEQGEAGRQRGEWPYCEIRKEKWDREEKRKMQ